jgi:hypothetical protein
MEMKWLGEVSVPAFVGGWKVFQARQMADALGNSLVIPSFALTIPARAIMLAGVGTMMGGVAMAVRAIYSSGNHLVDQQHGCICRGRYEIELR